mgnify:CR=1 FL=1
MKIIRSRAPLRIGFSGGGSDLKVYSEKYGGAVINATISLYVYCNITVTGSNKIIFESIDGKLKNENKVSQYIKHDGNLDIFKAVYNKIHNKFSPEIFGFHLSTYSEVPVGSGLGGSSTLVVSIITAFIKLYKLSLNKYQIAKLAFEIEREDMKIIGGQQDQYASVFGGFNFIKFNKNKSVEVNSLNLKTAIINELESSMVLFYTNIKRNAGQIEKEKSYLIKKNESIQAMHDVKKTAVQMKDYLIKGNIAKVAKLTDLSWEAKKSVSKLVSNSRIDKIYQSAIHCGAMGGKISGAGGGGFMFFYIKPEEKFNLINLLNKEKGYVINFKFSKEGAFAWYSQ